MILNQNEVDMVDKLSNTIIEKIMPTIKEEIDYVTHVDIRKVRDIYNYFLRQLMIKIGAEIYSLYYSEGIIKECKNRIDDDIIRTMEDDLNVLLDKSIDAINSQITDYVLNIQINKQIANELRQIIKAHIAQFKSINTKKIAEKLNRMLVESKISKNAKGKKMKNFSSQNEGEFNDED